MNVRTRFAPSPTGFVHVGSLRTALYAYLYAKKHIGTFILRIEDTDKSRQVEGSLENLINVLDWAGLHFDEGPGIGGKYGPYIQSERLEIYKKHAHELVNAGHAYHCFCSPERLESVRQTQISAKLPPAYDKHCRNLPPDEVKQKLATSNSHVIRMKVPVEGECTFTDLIRGSVTFGYKVIDDQVLLKSDGFPTYHLAVVVDDHYMNISHVIRGEEWLPSTPKHLLLYQYFGWQAPLFAHLPLLLNPDKSKLSKRQGDVAVEDYRIKGYLKEALINFVALLGWNPGEGTTQEIFSLQELMQEFSLEHVGKSGAVFNIEKLNWLNQQYIHYKKTDDELLALVKPLFAEKCWTNFSVDYYKKVINLTKDRAVVLPDFVTHGELFFQRPKTFDEKTKAKCWNQDTQKLLTTLTQKFSELTTFDAQALEFALRHYAEGLQIGTGKLMLPLRLALTGVPQGPSLFHAMEILGKEETCARINHALTVLT
ncbi:MAG: glutamate--tRNA ligase [bacterium]